VKNSKTSTTPLVVFGVIVMLFLAVGVVSILGLKNLNEDYRNTVMTHGLPLNPAINMVASIHTLYANAQACVIYTGNKGQLKSVMESIDEWAKMFEDNAAAYSKSVVRPDAKKLYDEGRDKYTKVFKPTMYEMYYDAMRGVPRDRLLNFLEDFIRPAADMISNNMMVVADINTAMLVNSTASGDKLANTINITLIIILVVSVVVVSIFFANYIYNSTNKPATSFPSERNVEENPMSFGPMTILTFAMYKDNVDTMKMLAANGLDVTREDETGETLMHFAAFVGSLNVMKWLCKEHGLNINKPSNNGDVPICIAAGCGHVNVVMWLLECGVDVNTKGQDGRTPLHQAAANGRIDMMRFLNGRANIDIEAGGNMTPLESAISNNRIDSIRCLVNELEVKVNAPNSAGMTAIFGAAAMEGGSAMIDCLAELGADTNARYTHGRTPIFIATEFGLVENIKCLVRNGADVNKTNDTGMTPILVATISGNPAAIECLASLRADVNVSSFQNGVTPIFVAVDKNNIESVKCLIRHGADLNRKFQGMTPLDLAIKAGRNEIEDYLRKNGAKRATELYG